MSEPDAIPWHVFDQTADQFIIKIERVLMF